MLPVELRTARLVLDQPSTDDVDAITRYCQVFSGAGTMTLPHPYRRVDAEYFVEEYVPQGWADDAEFTWAIREQVGGPLLGVLGYRSGLGDVGYWLGTEHHGRGIMTEALLGMLDWLAASGTTRVEWECVVGNRASAAVARRSGFVYTGTAPARVPFPDGQPLAWHGVRDVVDPLPAADWPEESR